jgi:DNA-directed RNA polymerase subunit RPC12/RpoP
MCGGCPKEDECSGLDGFYDGENIAQMYKCIYAKQEAIKKGRTVTRLQAESDKIRCPGCKTIIDVSEDEEADDALTEPGDKTTIECPECKKKLEVVVNKNSFLDATEVQA